MDLQILYNNPSRRERAMARIKRRRLHGKGKMAKNAVAKKVSKKKPAEKKESLFEKLKKSVGLKKKKSSAKKSYKKKSTKKVAKKKTKKTARKKSNPITVLSNPITVLSNPPKKKTSKKKSRKKVAKKKATRKVAKKKASKKVEKKVVKKPSKKKSSKKKTSKRKGSKKKVSKKAKKKATVKMPQMESPKSKKKSARKKARKAARKARKAARKMKKKGNPSYKASGKKSFKKKKHKLKGNPVMKAKKFGGNMIKKISAGHTVAEASGLLLGGAGIQLIKQMVVPRIAELASKIPLIGAPIAKNLDYIAPVAIGALAHHYAKNPHVKAAAKGLVGAAVVTIGADLYGKMLSKPMSGIIGVPMNGIIGVPQMNGADFGRMDADFGQISNSSDFGSFVVGETQPLESNADFTSEATIGAYAYEDGGEEVDF